MVTTRLYLDSRCSTTGTATMKVIVRKERKQAFLNLGIKVPINDWDAVKEQYTGSVKALGFVIRQKKLDVDNIIYDMMRDGKAETMSAMEIRDSINSIIYPEIKTTKEDDTLFVARFKAYIESCKTEGTRSIYSQTLDKVLKFDKKALSLKFEDITKRWLTDFDTFLSKTMKSENAKAVHYRNIRTIFNAAIDDEITTNYPFRKFKIKSTETKKRSLSVEQLRLFINAEIEDWQERYRDIFMLSFMLCGINIVDLCNLKHIENGRIEYRRAKTHKLYSIKVEKEAMAIINKYKGKDWLLNIMDNYGKSCDFNRRLKRGLDAIIDHINKNLDKKELLPRISSYWARHSWATIAAELDIPIETISAALGHSYGCTTTSIYIKFNQKKVDTANRKVLDFILNK